MFKKYLSYSFVFFVGSLLCSVTQAKSDQAAAIINGEVISFDSIESDSKLEVYEAKLKLYQIREAGLKSVLVEKLIALDPRSKGLSDNDFLAQFVIKPPTISDNEIDDFIKRRRIPQNQVSDPLKEQVRQYLMQGEVSKQIDRWVEKESKKHQVVINLVKPEEPRFDIDIKGAPYRGNKDAKVTIVEFSDFQCPFCSKVNDTLYEISQMYGDKIKVVYKHFPLDSIHPVAQSAARATVCAQQQGMDKFWALHNKLFENYRSLSAGRVKDFAKEIGVNTDKFNQCLTDPEVAERVQSDMSQGLALGVESTPAFFINGRFIKGALPLEQFKKVIDEELAD